MPPYESGPPTCILRGDVRVITVDIPGFLSGPRYMGVSTPTAGVWNLRRMSSIDASVGYVLHIYMLSLGAQKRCKIDGKENDVVSVVFVAGFRAKARVSGRGTNCCRGLYGVGDR